jgi:2-keto-4-pentenoate hydratase/2-oxohepta-3-ene-1,7-dioic acid hydratase in catechol pathway
MQLVTHAPGPALGHTGGAVQSGGAVHADGAERPGVIVPSPEGDRLLDLGPEHTAGATTVLELLSSGAALAAVRTAIDGAAMEALPLLADAQLRPALRPGKILCLGYNYRGHVPAGEDPTAGDPEFPDVFVKTPNVLAGPTDAVVIPEASRDVDYEGEIALVIGTRAKSVSVEKAMDHVAGYALFNDVSDRDWQGRSSQWELGKCFDGFGPLGPVTPAAEIAEPQNLLVEVEREGVVTVSQNTSTMIFPFAFLVHYLSQVMTLEPGDIISTGTPQKLPEALESHRRLSDGDAVTIRVAGLGELTTRFVAPEATGPDTLDATSTTTPEDNHDS